MNRSMVYAVVVVKYLGELENTPSKQFPRGSDFWRELNERLTRGITNLHVASLLTSGVHVASLL